MTLEGLKAISVLSKHGIRTNCTLVFSANQALLAARAGATLVSPFVGRCVWRQSSLARQQSARLWGQRTTRLARTAAAPACRLPARLDDIGHDGMQLIRDIVTVFRQYPDIKTRVLSASIRHPAHAFESAKAGCYAGTMPFKVPLSALPWPMLTRMHAWGGTRLPRLSHPCCCCSPCCPPVAGAEADGEPRAHRQGAAGARGAHARATARACMQLVARACFADTLRCCCQAFVDDWEKAKAQQKNTL